MDDPYFFYESTLDGLALIEFIWWDASPEGRAILNRVRNYLSKEGAASLPPAPKSDQPTINRPFNKFLISGSGVNADRVPRF